MSYDLTFVKTKQTDTVQVKLLVDRGFDKVNVDSEQFLTKAIKYALRDELCKAFTFIDACELERVDFGHTLELTEENFQLTIADGAVYISIPYWDTNANTAETKKYSKLGEILSRHGFIGFDPQTEKIVANQLISKKIFTSTMNKFKSLFAK